MKKEYCDPEIEIINISVGDVITNSNSCDSYSEGEDDL